MKTSPVVRAIPNPNSVLNFINFGDRKVRIWGYNVGVSASDTQFLNRLTMSMEFAVKETMPDERNTIWVKLL